MPLYQVGSGFSHNRAYGMHSFFIFISSLLFGKWSIQGLINNGKAHTPAFLKLKYQGTEHETSIESGADVRDNLSCVGCTAMEA